MKLRTVLCAVLVGLLLGTVPCVAAGETFNRWETLPTKHCDRSLYEYPATSDLRRKNVVFFGDSLCYARIERGDSNEEAVIRRSGYVGRIATRYGMEVSALGLSGATLAVKQGFGSIYTKLCEQRSVQSAARRAEVDYVILEGGVNDITAQVPLGTADDTTPDTFGGAVTQIIRKAKELYPNATVGFLIMYQMPASNASLHKDLAYADRYMSLLRSVCIREEIPYLDFFHDEDFNSRVFRVSQTGGSDACLSEDGIHMTVHGYDIITPYIAAWMSEPYRAEPKQEEKDTETTDTDGVTAPSSDVPAAPVTTDTSDPRKRTALLCGGIAAVAAAATVAAICLIKTKKPR